MPHVVECLFQDGERESGELSRGHCHELATRGHRATVLRYKLVLHAVPVADAWLEDVCLEGDLVQQLQAVLEQQGGYKEGGEEGVYEKQVWGLAVFLVANPFEGEGAHDWVGGELVQPGAVGIGGGGLGLGAAEQHVGEGLQCGVAQQRDVCQDPGGGVGVVGCAPTPTTHLPPSMVWL